MFDFKYYFELEEAVKQRVKIDPVERRKRKAEYRKNKQKNKLKQKKYRKTASYRKYKKRSARMSKQGKTSTGKRQKTLIRSN